MSPLEKKAKVLGRRLYTSHALRLKAALYGRADMEKRSDAIPLPWTSLPDDLRQPWIAAAADMLRWLRWEELSS